jgi:hypothetical protein
VTYSFCLSLVRLQQERSMDLVSYFLNFFGGSAVIVRPTLSVLG